ncbi:hypothetical protein DMJ13_12750 [halophilic archaeon]|nr:hypothetical protein DMJ13_12750 [halophilic archaeon]
MGRYGDIDYPTFAKYGFLLGLSSLVIGALGEIVGTSLYGTLPGWETMLFTDMEAIGIPVMLFSPFVFGVLLPLTE